MQRGEGFLHQIGINQLLQVITKAVKGDKEQAKVKNLSKPMLTTNNKSRRSIAKSTPQIYKKTALEAQILELNSKK